MPAAKGQYFPFILERLQAASINSLTDTVEQLLPDLIAEATNFHAYIVADGKVEFRPARDGEKALYWDGQSALDAARINFREMVLNDYLALAYRIKEANPYAILDLGAGACLLALALRHVGYDGPITCLDNDAVALSIGRKCVEALGIPQISFLHCDAVTGQIERYSMVVTREALHELIASGFHPGKLFQMADSGMHLDFYGHLTPTYMALNQKLPAHLPNPLPVAKCLSDHPNDAFTEIATHPAAMLGEVIEMWPHFINGTFPSLLTWSRR